MADGILQHKYAQAYNTPGLDSSTGRMASKIQGGPVNK